MKLYTIRRKSDGKFYITSHGHYAINTGKPQYEFATSPSHFLKTPDGVRGNLVKLCSEPYFCTIPPKGVCAGVARNWKELRWRNFDPAKLDLYEVMETYVALFSQTVLPANNFMKMEETE